MIRTILALPTGFGSDKPVLDAAVAAAKIEGAHIECLHTRIDAVETAAWVRALAPQRRESLRELTEEITREEQARSQHAQAAFRDACTRHSLSVMDEPKKPGEVSISWKEVPTLQNEALHRARFHDMVVMGRDPELSRERIINVLMGAGRPVLLAPPTSAEKIGRIVALAWKEGSGAARALMASSSILCRADRVVILSVSEDAGNEEATRASAAQLAKQFLWHGIRAEVLVDHPVSGSASKRIKEMAYNCGADLLVTGAYGHSRLREFVLGGVTSDVLADCAIPVLMFH